MSHWSNSLTGAESTPKQSIPHISPDLSLPTLPNDPRYALIDVSTIKIPRRKPGGLRLPHALRKEVLFAGPYGQLFTQASNLPIHPGGVGIELAFDPLARAVENPGRVLDFGTSPDIPDASRDDWGLNQDAINAASQAERETRVKKGRHLRRRAAQFTCWSESVIPSLVQPYLHFLRLTRNGRNAPTSSGVTTRTTCNCIPVVRISVTIISWDREYWIADTVARLPLTHSHSQVFTIYP
jgi:hypothetical protein